MRYPTEVVVETAILHSLDNRPESRTMDLSEAAIDLSHDTDLRAYLADHIKRSLSDPTAYAASFGTIDPDHNSGICAQILDDCNFLLDGSRALASNLYEIMLTNANISPGVVVVCPFMTNHPTHGGPFLAILKIDLNDVFSAHYELNAQGVRVVRLTINREARTITKEKLHKAAFVRPLNPRSGLFDMILLDRQVRKPPLGSMVSQPTAAQFFGERFLRATPTNDSWSRSHRFHSLAEQALNKIRDVEGMSMSQEEIYDQSVHTALRSATLNIRSWIDALNLPEEKKIIVEEVFREAQPDMEFTPDAHYVQKLPTRVTYTGDNGLRVSMYANNQTEVLKSVDPKTDGLLRYTEVVLHTREWKKVTR